MVAMGDIVAASLSAALGWLCRRLSFVEVVAGKSDLALWCCVEALTVISLWGRNRETLVRRLLCNVLGLRARDLQHIAVGNLWDAQLPMRFPTTT